MSKIFPFRLEAFLEGKTNLTEMSTLKVYRFPLTLLMLNKLRCHAHFLFPANQITWSGFLIEIHIFIGNSADPDQLASSEANWSGSTLSAKTGHVVFSKRQIKVIYHVRKYIIWQVYSEDLDQPGQLHILTSLWAVSG